jgi:hypothetical protein
MAGKITMPGLGVDPGKPSRVIPIDAITFDLNDDTSVPGYGQPVTLNAACCMIDKDLREFTNDFNNANKENNSTLINKLIEKKGIAVIFGKETLLRLLSQPNCEAIRFYSCINDDERASLVLCSVDKNGWDIAAVKNGKKYLTELIPIRNEIIRRSSKDIIFQDDTTESDEKGGPNTFSIQDSKENPSFAGGFGESLFQLLESEYNTKL